MKVYELLDSPEKWTKGTFARDSTGESILPQFNGPKTSNPGLSPDAKQWCLVGAIAKCYSYNQHTIRELENYIRSQLGYPSITYWNDDTNTTYEDVILVCKRLDI